MDKSLLDQDTPRVVLEGQGTNHEQVLEALRKSEGRFRMVFEHSNDAIFVVNPSEDEIIDCNPKACALLGFTRDELLSCRVSDIHPAEIRRMRIFAKSVFEKGHGWTNELTCLTKSGEVVAAEISASVIEMDEQEYMIALIRDITARKEAKETLRKAHDELEQRVQDRTAALSRVNEELKGEIAERKRAEEALRDREESFRLMFVNNPVPMWVFDEETLAFLAVNEAALRHYGYSQEEFLAMTIKDIRPLEEVAGLVDYLATRRSERRRVWDWRHRKKDGSILYVEIASHGLQFAGRPARLVLANVITERKKAEEQLRQYARRLEALQALDSAILSARSPEAIAQSALRHLERLVPYWYGHIALVDAEARAYTVLAKNDHGQAHTEAGVPLPKEVSQIPEEHGRGEVYVVEDLLANSEPGGATRDQTAEGLRSCISAPLIARGQQTGALVLGMNRPGAFKPDHIAIAKEVANRVAIAILQARLREQVERHAAELEQRVAERTAELEAFSYSVSHDLRTPLRAIDGFSRMLEEDYGEAVDEEGRRLIGVIRSNAKNMGLLIDGLLAFSRIGRREMQLCNVNVQALVEEVIEDLQAAPEDRAIHVILQPLPPVRGDRAMVRQVFVNLLSNAFKFTRPREEAVVEIGTYVDGGETVYYVRDNGVGFDQGYVEKLFGVFQRLHPVEAFEGTGVGLALVQRIIGRHGGRAWAEGQVGEGATIYFTLPGGGEKPC